MAEKATKDIDRATLYYRTWALQLDLGTETLRKLLEKHLKKENNTLDKLKHDAKVQYFLKFQQECLKQVKSIHEMDITLLTVVCEKLCKLSKPEKRYILKLRDARNTLAHLNKASLETQDTFDKTEEILIKLSQCISQECYTFVVDGVRDLQKRKLIKACSNRDKLMLEVEHLLEFADENRPPVDNVIWKKARLSLRVRDMARRLDIGNLLKELVENMVLTSNQKRSVERNQSTEERICHLVSLLLDKDTDEERFLRFCQCVRKYDDMLANIIEEDETDGLKTEERLHDIERNVVRECLEKIIKVDIEKSITTEEVHIRIETDTARDLEFHIIEKIVFEMFKVRTSFAQNGDTYFKGITLKKEFDEPDIKEGETGDTTKLSEMKCGEFSKYVGSKMEAVKEGLGEEIETAIFKECISSEIFKSMTQSDMKTVLTPYLTQNQKYGYGIEKQLLDIQKEISYSSPNKIVGGKCFLRAFDRPTEELKYKEVDVKPDIGNLLVPCHSFVTFPSLEHRSSVIQIAKHVMMFAAACINGCRNGTIHFGIKSEGDGVGKVLGMKNVPTQMKVDIEIWNTIKNCVSPKHVSAVQRCVRPTQVVPVENGLDVLEIDIVPFSGNLTGDIIFLKFPIKGKPTKTPVLFMFDKCSDIVLVSEENVKEAKKMQSRHLEERRNLECYYQRDTDTNSADFKRLEKLLTSGNMYMTDAFVPLILSGQISGITNEWNFRNDLNLSVSYITAYQVFDFDHSVQLRQDVENNEYKFSVKVIKDDVDKCDSIIDKNSWIYCNGNTDVSVEKQDVSEWYAHRCSTVRHNLDLLKKQIPQNRAIVIIYIFQLLTQSDPMFDIIKYCFLTAFRSQCVLITDQEANISSIREALMPVLDEVEIDKYIFTSLDWDRVSDIFKIVCRKPTERFYKLPCSNGSYITMNNKDREELNDLEIISGEQCQAEFDAMNKENAKQTSEKHEVNFFEGYPVSWWNFFFRDHVGKRRLYDVLKNEINEILGNEQDNYIINYLVRHHPGAGGSTLARHLLWHYSQFMGTPEKAYRCCIIQNITINTAEQIGIFREFKNNNPKPVLVLVDNKGEDEMRPVMARLEKLAYNKSLPGRLFCLVLIVQRFPLATRIDRGDHILEHRLDVKESVWFEKKYKELENRKGVDIETLLAFNVMKNSFDKGFIKELTRRILVDVLEHEITLLECMAFINTFDSDIRIPECIFDELQSQSDSLDSCDTMMPFGILPSVRQRQHFVGRRILAMSETLELLLKKHDGNELLEISILSQPLAESVLNWIINHKNITLVDVIENTLNMVCQHVGERNPVSEKFVKRVSSLFKVRQKCGEKKPKFSALITKLNRKKKGFSKVSRVLTKCFDVTTDPMVGQQLARFYIIYKKYEDAVKIIERCLRIKPNNSYLFDTYGQIHKTKMAEMLRQKGKQFVPALEEEVEIVRLAFEALDKFQESQKFANESNVEDPNLSLEMEVKTVLDLLDGICSKFQSVESSGYLRSFLNNTGVPKAFDVLSERTRIKELRKGTNTQHRIEKSLRILEEKNYQVKKEVYSVYVSPHESVLLTLRDRFEQWYNYSEDQTFDCNYGLGLKHLMIAKEKNKEMLLQRVNDAEERIRSDGSRAADFRDKMIFLGYNIIRITELNEEVEEKTAGDYEILLSCSTELVLSQKKAKDKGHRPFLEAFLYYAIIHWPSPIREIGITQAFIETLGMWKKAFKDNFYRKTDAYTRGPVPKTYFALGKGRLGQDIADFESIRKQWRNSRNRKHVKQDNVWQEEFVQNRLLRLTGHINETGREVVHKVNDTRNGNLVISTYYPCYNLINRAVTFFLGFTWKGPTAMDVKDAYETEGDISNTIISTHGVHQKHLKENIRQLNEGHDSCMFVPKFMRPSCQADADQRHVRDRLVDEDGSSIRYKKETSHTQWEKTERTENQNHSLLTEEIPEISLRLETSFPEEYRNSRAQVNENFTEEMSGISLRPGTSFLKDNYDSRAKKDISYTERKVPSILPGKEMQDISLKPEATFLQENCNSRAKTGKSFTEVKPPSARSFLKGPEKILMTCSEDTPDMTVDFERERKCYEVGTKVTENCFAPDHTSGTTTDVATFLKRKPILKKCLQDIKKDVPLNPVQETKKQYSTYSERLKHSDNSCPVVDLEQKSTAINRYNERESVVKKTNSNIRLCDVKNKQYHSQDIASLFDNAKTTADIQTKKTKKKDRKKFLHELSEGNEDMQIPSESLIPSPSDDAEQVENPKFSDHLKPKVTLSPEDQVCIDECILPSRMEVLNPRPPGDGKNGDDATKKCIPDQGTSLRPGTTFPKENHHSRAQGNELFKKDKLIQPESLSSTSPSDIAVLTPFGFPDAPMSSPRKLPSRIGNPPEDRDVISKHNEHILPTKKKTPKSLRQLSEKKQQDAHQFHQASSTESSSWSDMVKGAIERVGSEIDKEVKTSSNSERVTKPFGNSVKQTPRQSQDGIKAESGKIDTSNDKKVYKSIKLKGKRDFLNSFK